MWQPIETAPKDRFLLLCGPSGYTTTPLVFTTGCMYSDYHAGRWIDHANDDLTDWGFEPTHWAPLPEAPDTQAQRAPTEYAETTEAIRKASQIVARACSLSTEPEHTTQEKIVDQSAYVLVEVSPNGSTKTHEVFEAESLAVAKEYASARNETEQDWYVQRFRVEGPVPLGRLTRMEDGRLMAFPRDPQTQPAPSVPDGWKEAAIAWEVCASIHREYGKGKDPFFNTRQGDFVKHANDARAMLAAAPETKP